MWSDLFFRGRVKAEAELQLYLKGHKKEEEKKMESKVTKEMFDHFAKVAEKEKATELAKKVQFKKIQEENLKVAMLKKNAKQQEKVNDSLKEKDLIDSKAFDNKIVEVR